MGLTAGAPSALRLRCSQPEPLPWKSSCSGSPSPGTADEGTQEAGYMAGKPWLAGEPWLAGKPWLAGESSAFIAKVPGGRDRPFSSPHLPLSAWQRSPGGGILDEWRHVLWVGPEGREHPVLEGSHQPLPCTLQPAACSLSLCLFSPRTSDIPRPVGLCT